jgi:hypothetical protein
MKEALILAVAVSLVVAGCAAAQPKETMSSWEDVGASAASTDGREISLCGWFRAEFEVCTLSLGRYTDPALAADTDVWLAPRSDVCSLEKVTRRPENGWADVSGTFQHRIDPTQGFGHLGAYRSAISNAQVKMRKTPCDK